MEARSEICNLPMTLIGREIVREGYGTPLGEVCYIVVYGSQPIISIIQIYSWAIAHGLLIEVWEIGLLHINKYAQVGCFEQPELG